ncbi:class I SAM-dependent methyltransferase [Spirulina subsalsa FACHB-351]|uniref:Class I SAM-dependent methyltransferase n=1 Tax=Spirulina subsalsa FACHB-351 TaxID=234711 RepID=A0ABT3L414_9CYAN|nr:class I SAM-dependent methyltransferase [Spirulina subsalsa]MCW6035844.1 class I SAM-dependent methyltransferase [Spirulina subsalsa FACHB-351]
MNIFFEIHTNLTRESPGGEEYTRQALGLLPPLEHPNILDIGCGPGSHTLTLAQCTDGKITAVDTHEPFLVELRVKVKTQGYEQRVHCVNQSMDSLSFPPQSFDLIWSEGAVYIMGFEQGLNNWRSLLKTQGYLVVSELVWLRANPPAEVAQFWGVNYPGMQARDALLAQIPQWGYQVLASFVLPEAAWWNYYQPLEIRLEELGQVYAQDEEALRIIAQEAQEIEMYRQYKDWYGYQFFVLEKV